ncbi:hypothetical protein [Brevifollis gellanilyticus]|uniref:Uncharacterized protein n=1 Tax=Brevifollis gellanilyticus TaxID=748831 RepID=A0A512MHY1_9BACT|nr:hypothetical protein [Brevifollis gellanilyticus]GEP46338.1 hypothetical protein BGE01nite_56290 [Brevifollis gellanilyticus]
MHSPRLVLFLPLLLMAAFSRAEQPNEFSIQRYHFPAHGWIHFRKPPSMPPEGASEAEIQEFIRQSDKMVKSYLGESGVSLPPGSLGCLDTESHTLALRTARSTHQEVRAYVDDRLSSAKKLLSWRLEIIEAEGSDVRAMMAEAQGKKDHGALLDALSAKGRVFATMRGESAGSMGTTAQQGKRLLLPGYYALDENGYVDFEDNEANQGVALRLDPVLGFEDNVDLSVELNFQAQAASRRWQKLPAGGLSKVEACWTDLPRNSIKTSINFRSGETKLLGVWTDPLAVSSKMTAAFLCAHSVLLMPPENARIEKLLGAAGETVLATPKNPPPLDLPAGMKVSRYKVPPDFETMGEKEGSQAPPDTTKVQKILEGQGIPFPRGAYAKFISETSELVVCNTPENIDLVDSFTGVHGCGSSFPGTVRLSFHIVEAEAAVIRKLGRESEGLADHQEAWKALNQMAAGGKARFVRSAWMETRHGQQVVYENVLLRPRADSVSEVGAAEEPVKTKEGEVPAAVPGRRFYLEAEEDKIGFTIEADLVVEDERMITLNVKLENDLALPVTLTPEAPADPSVRRISAVTQENPEATFTTNTVCVPGRYRMIGVYQPDAEDGKLLHAVFVRADVVEYRE